jgi:hypothetical protein
MDPLDISSNFDPVSMRLVLKLSPLLVSCDCVMARNGLFTLVTEVSTLHDSPGWCFDLSIRLP